MNKLYMVAKFLLQLMFPHTT